MPRQLNPFFYGKPVPPSHFIGRETLINNCYNRLAGPVRSSVAISGEHGMGKTSFLHYLRHIATEEEWGQAYTQLIIIYLDCQAIKQFNPTRFWRHIIELLDQEKDNLPLQQQIETLLAQPEITAPDFQRLLRALHRESHSLVLLLDSFTALVKTSAIDKTVMGDFLASLRALTNAPDYPLTMLTATREPLDKVCYEIVKDRPGSRFYNNFVFETLTPFTPEEINTLLKQALAQANFELTSTDQTLLYNLAGAHPALLQMAGYHLVEAHSQEDEENYQKIIDSFLKSARRYFVLFWNEATLLEQSSFILVILASLLEQVDSANAAFEKVQNLLQQYERELRRLLERGILHKIENEYRLFSVAFAWWIIREIKSQSQSAFDNRCQTIQEEPIRRIWQTFRNMTHTITLEPKTQSLVTTLSPQNETLASLTHRSKNQATLPGLLLDVSLPSRYKLEKEIGRGASGIVYKSFDTLLTRPVAIKLLHHHISSPLNTHLLQEARTASRLDHPAIVTIYDIVEEESYIFLIMEYVEGYTLAQLLEEKKHFSLSEAIGLIEQAAAALDYAHDQGVIHRDIKPANLMITGADKLKLTDFGIAKLADEPQSVYSTGLKGTLLYMSPEQINQQPLDGRSDLFSLATVTFEMLSGQLPWPQTTYLDLMTKITEAQPRSLSEFDVDQAAILEPIFQKALNKNPDDRFQCGQDFVQALKEIV